MSKIDTNLTVPVASTLPIARRNGSGAVGQVGQSGAIGATATTKGPSEASATQHAGRSEMPFDAAKVARLRAAVLDGSYKVDSRKIAANLIEIEKKLP